MGIPAEYRREHQIQIMRKTGLDPCSGEIFKKEIVTPLTDWVTDWLKWVSDLVKDQKVHKKG